MNRPPRDTRERLTPYRVVRCPHCGHSHDLTVVGAVRLVPSDDGGLHLPCHECGKWLCANPEPLAINGVITSDTTTL